MSNTREHRSQDEVDTVSSLKQSFLALVILMRTQQILRGAVDLGESPRPDNRQQTPTMEPPLSPVWRATESRVALIDRVPARDLVTDR